MKTHFFQRYHSKENVDTANAMLLLNRLYSYSSDIFFHFLKKILPENTNVEMKFTLQEKGKNSVADAMISQSGFKIVVETKLNGDFALEQLKNHLNLFQYEEAQVLLTLDPKPMKSDFKDELEVIIREDNELFKRHVVHKHLTFEELSDGILDVISDRDVELHEILDDYRDYCYASSLISNDKKLMRVQLAGTTMKINQELNLYYDNVERGYSDFKYLGLYSQKAVRAIGQVVAIVNAYPRSDELVLDVIKGKITNDMKDRIIMAIEDANQYGYDLQINTRYFFVEKFYDTLYEKTTPYAPWGSRVFDLSKILGLEDLPNVETIASLLRNHTW